MILGFSVLGTILVINNIYPCKCTQIQMPQMPAQIRPAYTSMISPSDVPHVKQDDPTLNKLHGHVTDYNPTLRPGHGAAEEREGDYKITITIRNGTTADDDFWAN